VQARHSEPRPLEDARGPTSYEKHVRAFANHLALTVQRRGTDLVLREKYKSKRVLGSFRSLTAVERWLDQYLVRQLRKFDQQDLGAYEKRCEARKKRPNNRAREVIADGLPPFLPEFEMSLCGSFRKK
jgi:hypothetical protein